MSKPRKKPGPQPGPRDKSAARTVAGLLLLGATQKEAAEAAGVAERTIRDWITSEWWASFRSEALDAIDEKLLAFSHRALLSAVREGDATIAMKVVERLRPDTYGVKRVELTGKDGAPLNPPADSRDALRGLLTDPASRDALRVLAERRASSEEG